MKRLQGFSNTGLVIVALLAFFLFAIAPVMAADGAGSTGGKTNIVIFGNSSGAYHTPTGMDYSTLGGSSAIRRNGSIDTFYDPFVWYMRGYNNTEWVAVTHYAAIAKGGCLITGYVTDPVDPGKNVPNVEYTCTPSPGKQNVAISPYMKQKNDASGWPVLYQDKAGVTHLGMEGLMGPVSPSKGQYPIGTGWKMITSGSEHALALRSDGTVAGWGSSAYGSWNLPANVKYSDIAVGRYFSLGRSENGTIYAVGNDEYKQVSGKPAGSGYITIVADNGTAAALSHDGHIIVWGQKKPGITSTTDGNYTDIALGPDYLIAIKEPARELHITGPLSPGKGVLSREGTDDIIPAGSLFEHTQNGVMRVIGENGMVLFWVNDAEAEQVRFPEGTTFPSSTIHYLSNISAIIAPENYRASVYELKSTADLINPVTGNPAEKPLMTVSENSWYDEQTPATPQLAPQGVCFADAGCSAGATSRGQLFLSEPVPSSNGGIPVFSVREFCSRWYITAISALGSANPEDTRYILLEKDRVNMDQPVGFNIVTGNGSVGGTNVFIAAKANLTNQSSVLRYNITGTASVTIPEMNITPTIWRKSNDGDVLVFTANPVTCSAAKNCVAKGNFTPDITAIYYANATVVYTVPALSKNAFTGTQEYAIAMASDVKPCSVSCRGPPTGDYFDFTINKVKLDCHTEWQDAVCYDNALIRWAKAGKSSSLKSNLTSNRWKENSECTTDYSFAVDSPANKPVYVVAVNNNDVAATIHHAINTELLTSESPESTSWESWKFFQYTNLNIAVGDWQLPKGGSSFKTKVEIKEFSGILCGYWTNEKVKKTFYINQTGNVSTDPDVSPHMTGEVIYQGYIVNQTGKTVIKSDAVPVELQKIIASAGHDDLFTLNTWEYNPSSNETTFYVFDILDEKAIREFEGKNHGSYSVHIIHDTEFEKIRNDVGQQLVEYMNDPAYQIAHIGMSTNRISDPSENNAELWVYKSTPVNKELDNRVINGWTIRVYSVSGGYFACISNFLQKG